MAERKASRPVPNVQFRGNDGVLYQIPSAALARFAVPDSALWEKGPKTAPTQDGISLYPGTPRSVVGVDSSLLAHVIAAALESGIEDDIAQLLATHLNPRVTLPSALVASLNEAVAAAPDAKPSSAPALLPAGDGSFISIDLLTMLRFLSAAHGSGALTVCVAAFSNYEHSLSLAMPVPLANDFRLLMGHGISSGRIQGHGKSAIHTMMARPPKPGGTDGGVPDAGQPTPDCSNPINQGMGGCPDVQK
jgi:hypothetical protein